ncbi:SAF domain-containing protein [Trueperella pyogenes]|uniref:SAF domain-containing protein n=1 Tax=Trueperella pyogenes TaxID=1661 RepID=UPI0012D3382C|nr:SAF domain-containing protein [Trueperella pyogenes]
MTPFTRAPSSARSSPIRALMWRWRWMGVAMFAILAIHTIAPVPTPVRTFPAVVATRPLAGGERVTDDDVRQAMLTAQLPGVAQDTKAVAGEFVITPVDEGAPIFSNNLLSSEFLSRAPRGSVIAAVPIADASGLSIIHPGVRVNLFSAPDSSAGEAAMIAKDVLVAGVAHEKGKSTILGSTADTRIFYLAIAEREIGKVIGASNRAPLRAVLSGPVGVKSSPPSSPTTSN